MVELNRVGVYTTGVNIVRTALGLLGTVAVIVGVLVLFWPGQTAKVVAACIAIYAILSGLTYIGLGVFPRALTSRARLGHVALGLVFFVAGVIALLNLGSTAQVLAALLGIVLGIVWIIEGVVALTALGGSASKIWSVLFAVISIVAGISLLLSPLWAATVLWWLFGLSLVVIGVAQIVRALTFSPGAGSAR